MPIADIREITLNRSEALQQQLYEAFMQRIQDGRWPAGTRLPSSRQLAVELGISRNTVLAVCEQLKAEATLVSRTGKGVFVAADVRALPERPDAGHTLRACAPMPQPVTPSRQVAGRMPGFDNSLPFTPGLPDLKAFPLKVWNRLVHHQESRTRLLGYDHPQGLVRLREQVVEYLISARGVRCRPEQVIVTAGAQQALSLIAEVFLRDGDEVLIEDPGYRGAQRALGARAGLLPVPLRHQVIDISRLPSRTEARLLYCTPTHQYPMGGILSYGDRIRLLEWAGSTATWIIEDDYDSEFYFNGRPIPALQGLMPEAPVLYLGSFSKTLFPSLRLGYLVVPDSLVPAFVAAKHRISGESPLQTQAAVAEFLASGQFNRHVRRMREVYREKWQCFEHLLLERLPETWNIVAESAGMHVVVTGPVCDRDAVAHLQAAGLGSAPLSEHFLSEPSSQGLVLGFASASDSDSRRCVELLAGMPAFVSPPDTAR